eukprot:CAMPEP_0169446292 /NCGR_PEP_ID=MMETSP1042-20121227/10897_1 /TAXON_ID=464988 /ORGANISM="Hemiselmis andersenii, Strain CCMP1180" /LENGTH=110 /DNA_ID=CAMNT_0009557749 /DNA_START=8 /DNA_END=340 /DNA_ORIENTATION=+
MRGAPLSDPGGGSNLGGDGCREVLAELGGRVMPPLCLLGGVKRVLQQPPRLSLLPLLRLCEGNSAIPQHLRLTAPPLAPPEHPARRVPLAEPADVAPRLVDLRGVVCDVL